MVIVENKVEEYVQLPGMENLYKACRDAAAVCYQTDVDKMKKSPEEFVNDVLLKLGHGRALEFGTVYLEIPNVKSNVEKYLKNRFSRCEEWFDKAYVSTNLRVLAQGDYETDEEACANGYDRNWFGDLEFLCEKTGYHHNRRTFVIDCSRGAGDDFRTHIGLSSMMESTRFCNYSKGKFGGTLTAIRPYWITKEEADAFNNGKITDGSFLQGMLQEEMIYMIHAQTGLQAQQLKRLYPLWGKAQLRLCGFDDAWKNLFWRRCDEHADPECQTVAKMIRERFKKNN